MNEICPRTSSLKLRAISALILAPVALAELWFGGWGLAALVALAAVVLCIEWSRLTGWERPFWAPVTMIAAALAAILAAALAEFGWAIGLIGVAAAAMIAGGLAERRLNWLAAGVLYIGLPCVALLWLRQLEPWGLETVLWLFALVWSVDIGAYFVGWSIGGPRLAPRVSPNKTWAGLGGGLAAALLIGLGASALTGAKVVPMAALSVGLAIVEQGGDLIESAIKRHFHVKDAGRLIPGHGGLLDRVDGLIATLLAVALLSMAAGGSPLTWR
ncbi:MAG: phosphatidate cytidylyltransferase [Rhodospirillales bacterium]|nr:phosphatidate cytidylyltransferase [Rhodospirillales bacterium]